MEKLIFFKKGQFWKKGQSKIKFNVTKFAVKNFDDLKKVFKFSKENWVLEICNFKIKKIHYNFYINSKRVTKTEVIKIFEKCKKEF